ncbi:MAG: TetR/AcrR family transcriptional regulator [Desulfosarcinaceae bacterium]|jgi:AcrR family transcriptional regulator
MKNNVKRLPAPKRKKQILKCAVKVFANSNYYRTKVADIAAEAGISEAMVYRHFPTKKAIFLAVLRHMSDRILTFWETEIDSKIGPLDKLSAMGLGYYQRMIKHPNELKVQFLAISGIDDKEIFNQLRSDHQKYIRYIAAVIQEGIDRGEIRKDIDVHALALAYNGAGIMMNMMRLLSIGQKFNKSTVTYLLDHFIESIKA